MPVLEIKDAACSFGSSNVLRGINLAVEEGEFVSVIGFSGSGKTTLINLLSGLLRPTSGTVEMKGQPITGPGPERGVVFQNYSLLPWLTVSENVQLAVDQVFPDKPLAARQEHTAKYVRMVNLHAAAHKLPRELSGGMRQRVSVARALAMEPQILLLDEPLSALDALTRATLQDEIAGIWQRMKTTVVWITNDPDEALLLSERILPLTPGPAATLGPAIAVDIPRPRDRREMSKDPRFARLRNQLVNWLLEAKAKSRPAQAASRRLELPDILPEDLTTRGTLQFFDRRGPRRRATSRREEIEICA